MMTELARRVMDAEFARSLTKLKFSAVQVREIRSHSQDKPMRQKLAEQYGTSYLIICQIQRRDKYASVGD
jgi:hypothetical protein